MSKIIKLVVLGISLGVATIALAADLDSAKPIAAKVSSKSSEKVNINSADETALAAVKGIGKKKAKAIVDYRTKNGSFKSIDDLKNVKGIKQKWLDKHRAQLII
jgi:competence protein ComEA